jgi:acetyltransferase
MADVDVVECLDYLKNDDRTKVIGVYLEGYKEPRQLFEKMREVSLLKPIVLLKAGRSEVGSKAALSHTASLTGTDALYEAAAKQCGVIRVKDVLEWYEMIHALEKQPILRSDRVAVLTHIGGPGTLTVDRIGTSKTLSMANIPEEAKSVIRSMVAPTANVCNPDGYIDLTASHTEELHYKVLRVLFAQDTVDAVIQVLGHSMFLSQRLMAEKVHAAFEEVGKNLGKTFLNVVAFDESLPEFKLEMERRGLPTFPTPEIAVTVLEYMRWYAVKRERLRDAPQLYPLPQQQRSLPVNGKKVMIESEAYQLLEQYRIAVADYRVVRSIDEAISAAEGLGYPVVLKAQHPELVHKTDAGAVVLNIRDATELRHAADTIRRNLLNRKGLEPQGYLVQRMVNSGVEVIVGGVRDESFGPVVSFGSGGILVELLRDVTFRLAPINRSEAMEMIRETLASRLLEGFRGESRKDVESLADLLVKVSEIMVREEWIKELDLNPVKALDSGYAVVDARIISA